MAASTVLSRQNLVFALLVALARLRAGARIFQRLADFTPLSKAALFASTVLISFLSFRYLEMPIRTRALARTRRSIFATATVATLALLAFAGTARFNGGFPSRIDAASAALVEYERYSYGEFYRSRTCFLMLEQRATDFDALHCFAKSSDAINLLLWGDSLAASYSHGFRPVSPATLNVMQATASSCPPLIGKTDGFPNCASFNEHIRFLITRPNRRS